MFVGLVGRLYSTYKHAVILYMVVRSFCAWEISHYSAVSPNKIRAVQILYKNNGRNISEEWKTQDAQRHAIAINNIITL